MTLDVEDLQVSYAGVEAVRGVTLWARPGEISLLLGANGAGKTTTLKAIAGLLRPAAGTVRLDGEPVTGLAAFRIARRGLALVPEGRRLFAGLTVEENLLMGGYVASAADRARTLDEVYSMFPILRERRRGPAGLLSGGEQQMLAFGRARMSQARVVLLDEPSMGLAPALVGRVLAAARALADSGLAVLMVEQNANAALPLSDTVFTMVRGQITFQGTPAQLQANQGLLHALLGDAALGD